MEFPDPRGPQIEETIEGDFKFRGDYYPTYGQALKAKEKYEDEEIRREDWEFTMKKDERE